MKILVLGASGFLGSSLSLKLDELGIDVLRQSRSANLDIQLNPLSIQEWIFILSSKKPDMIINCMAATNVDECEKNPQYAFDANVSPLLNLVKSCKLLDVKPHLIHISTDQLYTGHGPHAESDVHPCNVYGWSKLAAELAINSHPSTILRTNFFGRSFCESRRSFSDWVLSSLLTRAPITLFDDVLFSAVHLNTLIDFIISLINEPPLGIFNYGCHDAISKAGFGLLLASSLGFPRQTITIGSINSHRFSAKRPLDMSLDISLISSTLSITCPSMDTEVQKVVDEFLSYRTNI